MKTSFTQYFSLVSPLRTTSSVETFNLRGIFLGKHQQIKVIHVHIRRDSQTFLGFLQKKRLEGKLYPVLCSNTLSPEISASFTSTFLISWPTFEHVPVFYLLARWIRFSDAQRE